MILGIETSGILCSAAIFMMDGTLLAHVTHNEARGTAGMLSVIIDDLLQQNSLNYASLKALALSGGPGSYTGLRIGAGTAKGICFAKDIPLIHIDTLGIMANAAKDHIGITKGKIIVLSDARRDEVYTATYTNDLECISASKPLILTQDAFAEHTDEAICFIGDGASKTQKMLTPNSNWQFHSEIQANAQYMNESVKKYENKQFEDLAYYEPNYLKEYHFGN